MNVTKCLFFPVAKFPLTPSLVFSSGFAIGLNIVMAVGATFGNALVILAIRRTRELQTNSNILIVFLALTDLFVGLLVQPLFIANEMITVLDLPANCVVVVVYTVARVLCSILSLVTVLLISLERSLVIFKPLKYSSIVTKRKLVTAVIIIWIFWSLIVSSRFIGLPTKYFRVLVSAVIIMCYLSTGVAYVRISKLASQHLRSIKNQFTSAANGNNFTRHYSENKALKTTMIITGCVFLCYTPLVAVLITNIAMGPRLSRSASHMTFTWADTLVYINSALNPIIYCLRNVEFRRGIAKVLGFNQGPFSGETNLDRNISRSTTIETAVSEIGLNNPVLLRLKYLNENPQEENQEDK